MSSESNREVVETFGDSEMFEEQPLERITGRVGDDRKEQLDKAEDTQQADVDEHAGLRYYHPPYNPERLLLMLEQSETAQRCTVAISQGVAGYGFDLVPNAPDSDGDEEPPGHDTVEQLWRDGDFLLGPDEILSTPEAVLEHAYHDRVGCGYGSMEVLLNDATYTPTGLAHIPAHTIRRRQDKPGYVQLDDGQIVRHFGPAGGRDNGVFVDTDGNVGSSAAAVGDLANELIVTTEYSPLAPHYGIPPIVPALQTLSADLAAREYQYRFFENDGVPRFAVITEGGDLTDRAWEQLQEKLKDLKGAEDSHRGILIEATGDATKGPGETVNVSIEPLTVGEQEDAGFIEYRKENEHDIAMAFNVPPIVRNRTEDVNYNSAQQQTQQFAQSEIGPRQNQFAAQLTKVLHETMLEVDGWELEFELHGGENELRQAEVAQTRSDASMGALTVNELRDEVGREPLTDESGDELPQGQLLGAQLQQQGSGGGGGGGVASDEVSAAIERAKRMEGSRAEKASYSEGDVVEYDSDGHLGVVSEVMTESFTEPVGDEDEREVDASPDSPAFVVVRQTGGFGVYRASDLSSGSIPEDEQGDPDEIAETDVEGSEKDVGWNRLPPGWSRLTLLDAWSSMGGSFRGCRREIGSNRVCASMKDEVYGTTRWRGRF